MIIIDYQDRRPLYEQIAERFKTLIIRGALAPDAQMPSVRSLAVELSINPNTIQKAYAELERQGFIYPVKGRGNFVSPEAKVVEGKKKEYERKLEELIRSGREMGILQEEMQDVLDRVWLEKKGGAHD